MDAKLQETIDLLIENRNILKKKLRWETDSNDVAIMASFIMTANGVSADPERFMECKKILKKNVDIFSEFRGIGKAMVISKMMLSSDPEEYLSGAMQVYKKLRSIHKLTASPFMVMAAMTIYESGGLERADENIEKLEELYKTEKKLHPIIVNDQDRGYFAMILAFSLNPSNLSAEIEECYRALGGLSIDQNSVHSLCQVLSLSNKSVDEKTEEVKAYVKGFKKAKHPVSKSYGLSALGVLTLLDTPMDKLIDECTEVADYLKGQKGFGIFYMGKRVRLIYATLAVFMSRAGRENAVLSSNISATLAMVLVEQLIMLMVIATTTAARASSSSSSSSAS